MIKPHYMFFYKNDKCLDNLLYRYPFNEKPINKTQEYIDWEHYTLFYKKCNKVKDVICGRGKRTWTVLIEEELYKEIENNESDLIYDVLYPMTSVQGLLGGEIKLI